MIAGNVLKGWLGENLLPLLGAALLVFLLGAGWLSAYKHGAQKEAPKVAAATSSAAVAGATSTNLQNAANADSVRQTRETTTNDRAQQATSKIVTAGADVDAITRAWDAGLDSVRGGEPLSQPDPGVCSRRHGKRCSGDPQVSPDGRSTNARP